MRSTWMSGDGPQTFLASKFQKNQRHHLSMYGDDAGTDRVQTKSSRRFVDLSRRDLSRPNKERNDYLTLDSGVNAGLANCYTAAKHSPVKSNRFTDKVQCKQYDLEGARRGDFGVAGKVGSAHFAAKGANKGSWDVAVYDAKGWENSTIYHQAGGNDTSKPRGRFGNVPSPATAYPPGY